MRFSFLTTLLAVIAAALMTSCGGGSSSAPATPTTTISGTAAKGPVNGAAVTVKDAATGAVLGATTTGAGGAYKLDIVFSGDVIVEVSGGTYTDEATGASTPLTTPMKVVLAANGGTVTGVVTPLTTMAFNSAFGTGAKPTSAGFKTVAAALAAQFKLVGVDLSGTVPTVGGSTDAYGKVLAGISRYLKDNGVALGSLISSALSNGQWTAFSGSFAAAYNAANPGTPITFAFDGSKLTVGGTGAGGGTGTCGVTVSGTVNNLPISQNVCVSGIAAGSCSSGNSSLAGALPNIPGAVSLTYTYSPTCAPGATLITLN